MLENKIYPITLRDIENYEILIQALLTPSQLPVHLTASQAAALLHVAPSTFGTWKWRKQNGLKAISRGGNKQRYLLEDVLRVRIERIMKDEASGTQ